MHVSFESHERAAEECLTLEKQLCRAACGPANSTHHADNPSVPVDLASLNKLQRALRAKSGFHVPLHRWHTTKLIFIALSLGRRPSVSNEKACQALPMFHCHQRPPD